MSLKSFQNDNKFNFFVEADIKKGKNTEGGEVIYIEGIASTSRVDDSDGETLFPSGYNLEPFLERGLVNYNHKGSTDSNANIGIPVEAKVINAGQDLYVKCMLWPCPQTDGIIRVYENFKKYSPNRKVGFSIEGFATERMSNDKKSPFYKKITKADVTGLAVTFSPKNKNSLMSIIKGEYSEAFIDDDIKTCPKCDHDQLIDGVCLECGYSEKSMDTAGIAPATPESVEHDPKLISNKFGNIINKSEIYTQIAKRYPTSSIAEIKNIYKLVEAVNTKNFKMEDTKISSEAISKAFQLLDSAESLLKGEAPKELTADPIVKSEEASDVDENEVEKALGTASMLIKAGMQKDAACDVMSKGGGIPMAVAQASWEKALSEMNAQQNGGTPETVVAPIMKSEDVQVIVGTEIQKSFESFNKDFSGFKDVIQKGFEGLKTLYQSQVELNTELAGKIELLSKTPQGPRKSVSNVQALDKFQKSENGEALHDPQNTFNITMKNDLNRLVDRLFDENDKIKKSNSNGQGDQMLEGAISTIESQNIVPKYIYQRCANLGLKLVAPSNQ